MRDEAGQTLVVFLVFFIPVIVAAGAMSIDLGRAYLARVDYSQVATMAAEAGAGQTDLCALAGGEVVLNDGSAATACSADSAQPSAQATATDYLKANLAAGGLGTVQGVSVTVVQNGVGGGGVGPGGTCYRYPSVVVSFHATIRGLIFAGAAFNKSTQTIDVHAAATVSEATTQRYAQAGPAGGGACGA